MKLKNNQLGYIKDNPSSSVDLTNVNNKINKKVDKEEGKGLSTNDYTNEDKAKLDGVEEGANKITKVSELENDSDFITKSDSEEIKQELNNINDCIVVKKYGTNILDKNAEFIHDKGLGVWEGANINTLFNRVNTITSGIIELNEVIGKKYCILGNSGTIVNIGTWCLYDADGTILKTANTGIIDIPNNAKFIRLSFNDQSQFDSIASIQPYEDKNDKYILSHYGIKEKDGYLKNNSIIPIVCFNFDETKLDNRYTTLKNNGYTATWQFAHSFTADNEVVKTLVSEGHDFSPYSGLEQSEYEDLEKQEENVQKLKTYIEEILEKMKDFSLYRPTMLSCSRHQGGYIVKEAIKDLNFRYIRCDRGIDENGKTYFLPISTQPNELEQVVVALNQHKTYENIKAYVDYLVEGKSPLIMLMCHSLSYDEIIEENYFENLVDYIKTLEGEGRIKVMNMREYYELHYPEQGLRDDRIRIFEAINHIKDSK